MTTRSPSVTSSIGDSYRTNQESPSEEDALKIFEQLMADARSNLGSRELELSLQQFTSALHVSEENPELADRRYEILGNLGWIERLRGRYANALNILNEALALADARPGPPTRPRVQITGELGTIYRQMGRLEEAQEYFSKQYGTAKELNLKGPMCRAIGNLGIVRYQQALTLMEDPATKADAEKLIHLAMEQLHERIKLADEIVREEPTLGHTQTTRSRQARLWKGIAKSRLSLCYMALASLDPKRRDALLAEAVDIGKTAVYQVGYGESAKAISLFIYGRALLLQGKKELALKQFNRGPDELNYYARTTSPVMAFCKEPSAEHRGYLRELIDAGADLTLADQEGYTALDHAVFSGDAVAENMVLAGLKRQLSLPDADLAARTTEARLRKGYREIFQEKLRPVLYRTGNTAVIKRLRAAYAEALADPHNGELFDPLKVIRFAEFAQFGRLPRSSDGLARAFGPGDPDQLNVDFVIFFSYRWINRDKARDSPDDVERTQYRRMLDAVELFLAKHPDVDRERLGVWMDFACVNQDNPGAGVSALPIIVAQCDAVISLVDDVYYDRAWCCVEAMMISQLMREPRRHLWYEHVPAQERGWRLRKAVELNLKMKDKLLTYEEDRPKVLFLERQCRLLGRKYYR